MRTRSRRRLDSALLVAGGLGVGVASLVGAVAGDTERITGMWIDGQLADDGTIQITEVIDYDFGGASSVQDKHGIFRIVPDLDPGAPISAESDTAADDVTVTEEPNGTKIRVGSPSQTVSGEHRYRLEFPITGAIQEGRLDWEAVGAEWPVPIEHAEVHLVAPFELTDMRCFKGASGSSGGCDIRTVEPGHVAVTVDDLDSNEGVSVEGRPGSDLAAAPALPGPPARPDDDETSPVVPAGAAAAAALLAAGPTAVMVRRAGRERVGAGGAADAAFAGESVSEVRMDHAELEKMATTEFAPPEDLTPPHGGIVLAEAVRPEHKVAWLIDAAIEGAVDLVEEGKRVVALVRTGPGSPETAAVLDRAFYGRDRIELDQYDSNFAAGWQNLDGTLEIWHQNSGLWDQAADMRRMFARSVGAIVAVVGAFAAGLGGVAVSLWGASPWLAVVIAGGLAFGGGLAAAVRGWEMRVRTPAGSAAWLRVESFRRFLAGSEAYHAEEAAKLGVLREYTAWAVALGEIDRWARAVAASTVIPAEAGVSYAYMAPALMMSTTSASTQPSSSGGGGGGFGGGSVGGGAGGGGGGSW